MILGFEIVFASTAAILSILSFKTLRAIKHLGVGRSFWIPVFVSSVTFLMGSTISILYEIGFALIAQTTQVVQVSRILALCFLLGGIYNYSRRVKGSLKEEFSIPEQLFKERSILESPNESSLDVDDPMRKEEINEGKIKKDTKKETIPACKHRLGYLQTLSKNASIPAECLGCDKIIECKHSLVRALREQAHSS